MAIGCVTRLSDIEVPLLIYGHAIRPLDTSINGQAAITIGFRTPISGNCRDLSRQDVNATYAMEIGDVDISVAVSRNRTRTRKPCRSARSSTSGTRNGPRR